MGSAARRWKTSAVGGLVDNRWARTRVEAQQLNSSGGLQGDISSGGGRWRRGRLMAGEGGRGCEPYVMRPLQSHALL